MYFERKIVMMNENTIGIDILNMKEIYDKTPCKNKAYVNLTKDMIEYFDADRCFVGMKSVFKNECMPVVEYFKNNEKHLYGEVVNFDGFTKFATLDLTKVEQTFIHMCKNNNYFTTENNDELDKTLKMIGYEPCDLGIPTESLIFCTVTKESFAYLVMERYEKKGNPWSEMERRFIADLQKFINLNVSVDTLENRLDNEMRMKNKIVENENIPICLVDSLENRVIYYNNHYEKHMPNIHLGMRHDDLFDNDESNVLRSSDSVQLQKKSDGTNHYWIKKSVPFTLVDGTEVRMIYIKDTEEYIEEMAHIDLLTSAYSVRGFEEMFKNVVIEHPEQYMLCTIDIEKFKYINDKYSFDVGNQILQRMAKVLDKFMQNSEFFCRTNEDKFAFVLQSDTKEASDKRIKGLFNALDLMQSEHFLDLHMIFACGVTTVHKDIALNFLIDRADAARKTVKGSHKSVVAFFDREAEQKLIEEISIGQKVPKAVENKEFIPFLQPKFDMRTMEICGAEALVRWIAPTGMIFPDQFIPLFERDGFIDTLDFIIYKQVMMHIRECLDQGLTVHPVSLNVSRNHIRNKNFVAQIMELIEEYNVPIELLELEVTESIFVEDREVLKFFIDNIKRPKIKVSIDDFGSAYSSLQLLKDVDIDILKIDKGFLDNIDFTDSRLDTRDEVVLKNIVQLAKDLKCKVICEGVETQEQVEMLKGIGCEYGQGYVFARPMPIDEYVKKFLN